MNILTGSNCNVPLDLIHLVPLFVSTTRPETIEFRRSSRTNFVKQDIGRGRDPQRTSARNFYTPRDKFWAVRVVEKLCTNS
jgi:hypothetical protein